MEKTIILTKEQSNAVLDLLMDKMTKLNKEANEAYAHIKLAEANGDTPAAEWWMKKEDKLTEEYDKLHAVASQLVRF